MVIARVVRDIQHSILARDVTAPDRTLYSVAWYSSCGETKTLTLRMAVVPIPGEVVVHAVG